MDLKELCKKVDRIAIIERSDLDPVTENRFGAKKYSRSGKKTRYVFHIVYSIF